MSQPETAAKMRMLEGWQRTRSNGHEVLRKSFEEPSFLAGIGLLNRVAAVAERLGHHPDVELTCHRVTLTVTTHEAGGITPRDFDLAAAIDELT